MKISEKLINEFKSALSSEGLRFTDQRLLILLVICKQISNLWSAG